MVLVKESLIIWSWRVFTEILLMFRRRRGCPQDGVWIISLPGIGNLSWGVDFTIPPPRITPDCRTNFSIFFSVNSRMLHHVIYHLKEHYIFNKILMIVAKPWCTKNTKRIMLLCVSYAFNSYDEWGAKLCFCLENEVFWKSGMKLESSYYMLNKGDEIAFASLTIQKKTCSLSKLCLCSLLILTSKIVL